ncbi:helix-turn-helix transcriptional regulator [Seonamhaeicola sp.]|uniref:helix-turn-helix domain-containing protein n=1 Tax=Seonamhaeicola sp. TaxID=1912245 RepID=UPI00261DA7AD|nr:helix-turn-helix transcriptional regulator [Seonamhaeicola sp.]
MEELSSSNVFIMNTNENISRHHPNEKNIDGITPHDLVWINEIKQKLKENIRSGTDYKITDLAYEMAICDRSLRYKIRKITGLSPIQYFREIRLDMAFELLDSGSCNCVSEVAYQVGYKSTGHFTRLFEKHFGIRPSNYLKLPIRFLEN